MVVVVLMMMMMIVIMIVIACMPQIAGGVTKQDLMDIGLTMGQVNQNNNHCQCV